MRVKDAQPRQLTAANDPSIASMVARARALFSENYSPKRFPGLAFDNPEWLLSPRDISKGVSSYRASFNRLLLSGKRNARGEPMPRVYTDVVKAWLVIRGVGSSATVGGAYAASWLWLAIETDGAAGAFGWDTLRDRHFETAQRLLAGAVKGSTADHVGDGMGQFLSWLKIHEVVSESLNWIPQRLSKRNSYTVEAYRKRLDRLPDRRALEALGEIYQKHAKTWSDRFLICAIGLLLVTGFRLGELLSLPADCLFSEKRDGRKHWGVRYWKSKSTEAPAVRWLSPLGAVLAKRCFDELVQLTEAPRRRARELESDPSRVVVPWGGAERLTPEETARAFGVPKSSLPAMIFQGTWRLEPVRNGRRFAYFLRVDVEAELLRLRGPIHTKDLTGGRVQKLSESLLISFHNQFDATKSARELLVQNLAGHMIPTFLGGQTRSATEERGERPSAFERFGFVEPWQRADGEAQMRMRTHMVRHWLNTVANKAGMTAFQITLWMNRLDPEQTREYLHGSADIADISQELLRDGRLRGVLAERHYGLPDSEKDDHLATITEGHRVSCGYCLNGFTSDRCRLHKTCELNCRYFVWRSDDAPTAEMLVGRRASLDAAIERIDALVARGVCVQARQRELLTLQRESVNRALSDAQVTVPDAS
jgi:hypothetical protein